MSYISDMPPGIGPGEVGEGPKTMATIVTASKIDDMVGPGNLVMSAAVMAEARAAIQHLQRALRLPVTSSAIDAMPDEREWSRMPIPLRLQKIGDWLRAECFRLSDIQDAYLVMSPKPSDTVGTND